MENPMKESYVNPQIAEAARWQTRERVALGFSIFFGLIMASAVTDIFLAGAITNFLAASIPFIAPVLLFISFGLIGDFEWGMFAVICWVFWLL